MKMGKDPDYRFSLANERTFLAWIRTALAFLATSIGIDLLSATHDSPILRHAEWLTPGLAGIALATTTWAFLRWYQNEKAMRLEAPFKYSKSLLAMTLVVISFAILIGYLAL
ncbi:YidH family protein [Vibrio sp. TRT 21S02]|uniref:YidH family protein n=1 Tax=Vibrio sp. TRT 21S02 TaxID=3418507 RepID=UPI003CFB9A95